MAVTLAQSKLNVTDDLQLSVIDEFRKSNWLLDHMSFADVASPVGGGAGYTYAYTRVVTPSTADFRAVNEEYTANEAEKQRYTVDLKVFGGTFNVDRVIAKTGGIIDEVAFQMSQKVKATKALFNDTVINGNSSTNAKAFDGLDVGLAGTATEFNTAATIDLTTTANIKANADDFLLMLHKAMGKLNGMPDAFLCNSDMKAVLEYIAKYEGRYQQTQDEWGRYVSTYNGIPIVDVGAKAGNNNPVIANGTNGTDLYMVRFDVNEGFHGISRSGGPIVEAWMPDFSTAGAVKTGEVEMIAACALKTTQGAGVLRRIKVVA